MFLSRHHHFTLMLIYLSTISHALRLTLTHALSHTQASHYDRYTCGRCGHTLVYQDKEGEKAE
jgi:hypothetical protein